MEDYYSKGSCFAQRVEEQINTAGSLLLKLFAVFCMLVSRNGPHETTTLIQFRHGVTWPKIFSALGNNSKYLLLFKTNTAASSRCVLRWDLWEVKPTPIELKQYKGRVKKWDLWSYIDWCTQGASNRKGCRHLSVLTLSLCCNSRLGEVKHFFLLSETMPRSQFDLPCRVHSGPSSSLPGAAIPLPYSATKTEKWKLIGEDGKKAEEVNMLCIHK